MAVGEDDGRVGMNLTVRQPRHAMVHAPGRVADLGMQRAAEGDVHFLEAAAHTENRDAALDADLAERERQIVAALVVGFVAGVRLGLEAGGVDIRAAAGEQHAVDDLEAR